MKIVVLPRLQCEALPLAAGYAFISITNPRQAPAVLPANAPVLRLGFHDIEAPLPGWTAMTPTHASQVFEFVEGLPASVQTVVVHCEHGASRSSAIGLTLGRWLDCAVEWQGDGVPNPHVLQMLRRAAFAHAMVHPTRWPRAWRVMGVSAPPATC